LEVKIETDSNDAVGIKTEADSNDITEYPCETFPPLMPNVLQLVITLLAAKLTI